VLEVELKQLHRGRTVAAVTTVALAAGFVLYGIIEGTFGGLLPGTPEEPPELLPPGWWIGRAP
jgi:hypothetical protein